MLRVGAFLICLFCVSAGEAQQNPPSSETNAVWGQFLNPQLSNISVEDVLSIGAEPYLIWKGSLNQVAVEVYWDPVYSEFQAAINEEHVSVLTTHDEFLRPSFSGTEDGITISGYVGYVPEADLVIFEFSVNGKALRGVGRVSEDPSGRGTFLLSGPTRSCVCFGKPGGTTRSCSNDDCDTGVSCGSSADGSNKACRWKAGPPIRPTSGGPVAHGAGVQPVQPEEAGGGIQPRCGGGGGIQPDGGAGVQPLHRARKQP